MVFHWFVLAKAFQLVNMVGGGVVAMTFKGLSSDKDILGLTTFVVLYIR